MARRIIVDYQVWDSERSILIHRYKPFDYDVVLKSVNTKAIERYEYCLKRFLNLAEEDRRNGLIYGGIEFDFSFQEVDE